MSDLKLTVTYKPEGVEPMKWAVDLVDGIRASEYIAVRQHTKGLVTGPQDMLTGVQALDMLTVKALIWLLMKRRMSTVSWEELDFTLGEVELSDEQTPEELRARLERLDRQGLLNELGKEQLKQLVAAGVEADTAEDDDPKA